MKKGLLFLLSTFVFLINDIDAQLCNKIWLEGYVIYYRDTIGNYDVDFSPNHYAHTFFFEDKINFSTVNRYFNINDTLKYIEVDKPWGGRVYIDDSQRSQFERCLENENLDFARLQEYKLFSLDDIPDFLIKSKVCYISIFKST